MSAQGSAPAVPADGASAVRSGSQIVLLTLAAGQFLMTLDSSVMNVSIATVAKDVGTTVTGIQGAITAYTLVMAALMITGGKIGGLIGRKRAFSIGCVIYGAGSLTTSLAPNLPVLLFGWSFLEGVGAALILPAIVALVAGNFPIERRPAAYGLVAAAGAVAVAVGPLIGGFATTYFSWRWVFAGEVVVVIAILLLTRKIADAPVENRPKFDLVGAVLSAAGLALLVFGILRSGEWGWIRPHEGGPSWANLSPTVWLVLAGLFVIWLFFTWEYRREAAGKEPLIRPAMLKNRQLSGGLIMFFFQYLVQAGFFFVVPLFLSVCLGLSALATGVRLLPLSATLLAAAIGIPRVFPRVSPRLVVRIGLLCLLAGTVVLLAALDADAGAEIVFVPMLLIGLGIGALASQLGAVTVSAVSDDQAPEVGGVQNTMTNLGASIGTALAGSILIASLSSAFLTNIEASSAIPSRAKSEAHVQLAGGVPFISDDDLQQALSDAHVSGRASDAAVSAYQNARITGLRAALAILGVMAILSLFFTRRIPTKQPGAP
jgi:EmrB/QacA subfamily drug resistance transporter